MQIVTDRVIQQPCQIWQVQIRQHRRPMRIMIDRFIQQLCQFQKMQGCQEGQFGLLVITWEKWVWSLVGTRLPGKVRLLARVLVKTMAMASVWIFHVRRHHRLISKIGHRWLGMYYIRRTLGRVAPCWSRGDKHSILSAVPLIVEIITPYRHSGKGNGFLLRIPRP